MGVDHPVVYALFALESGQSRLKLWEVSGQGFYGSINGSTGQMDDPYHGSNLLYGAFGPGVNSGEYVDGPFPLPQSAGQFSHIDVHSTGLGLSGGGQGAGVICDEGDSLPGQIRFTTIW